MSGWWAEVGRQNVPRYVGRDDGISKAKSPGRCQKRMKPSQSVAFTVVKDARRLSQRFRRDLWCFLISMKTRHARIAALVARLQTVVERRAAA